MQLSLHADYSLRVLLYLGAHPGRVISTDEISRAYRISRHHLVRVVQTLASRGYVRVSPGRAGGVSLLLDPAAIRIGDVVAHAEPNLRLVECFEKSSNTCPITPACELKVILKDAMDSFFETLNRRTLADLLAGGRQQKLKSAFFSISITANDSHAAPRAAN
jgi:Rrf2 family transcriptional regulator, nitric oxide-sensitive transcriptional repressor